MEELLKTLEHINEKSKITFSTLLIRKLTLSEETECPIAHKFILQNVNVKDRWVCVCLYIHTYILEHVAHSMCVHYCTR